MTTREEALPNMPPSISFRLFLCLVKGGEYQHSFAGTETVSLEDVGSLQRLQEGKSFLQMLSVESLVACRGDMVALHECLGEILGPLQYRTSLCGTDDRNVLGARVSLHVVVDTLYQWVFRTNDHHVDVSLHAEVLHCLEVIRLHGNVLTAVAGSRITWGDKQFLTFLTLSNFPGEGMLSSAAA